MDNKNPFTIGSVYSIDQLFKGSNPITNWDDNIGKKKEFRKQFEENARRRNKQREKCLDEIVLQLIGSGDKATEMLVPHFNKYPNSPEIELRVVTNKRHFSVLVMDLKTKKTIFEKHNYSIGVQPIENLTLRRVSTGKTFPSLRIVKV